ncbi:MAG: DNA polymerase III subunit beta [Clostridia bacterium]|nr:DNA polymerase III subunit beta [Clostridia bacterium]
MKFVCEGIVLSDAAVTVNKACAVKTVNPVMECIKISAFNDVLILTAYDGEICIEKKVNAEVVEEGEVCVNGRLFTDFIGKIAGKTITVSTGENGIEIRYDDSSSFMQSLDASTFPEVRKDAGENSFRVKNNDLKNLIGKTVFCCATDDSRPILKGCLLETADGKLYATALDGYRMAVSSCEAEGESSAKIVCPARTLTEISRMLDSDGDILEVNFSKNTLSVSVDGTSLTSRLYTGEFVNKANIFPPTFVTSLYVKRDELIESVERASVLIRGDKNNLIIMDVKAGGAFISANSEIGNVSETVKGTLDGKELKIAMNAKFLLDALKALDGEIVKLSFNTPIAPFTLENEDGGESSYLVLPVRTNA